MHNEPRYNLNQFFVHKKREMICFIKDIRKGVKRDEWLYTLYTPSIKKYSSYFETDIEEKCNIVEKCKNGKILFGKERN